MEDTNRDFEHQSIDTPEKTINKKSKKKLYLLLSICIVIFLAAVFFTSAAFVYKQPTSSSFSRAVVNVLPFPAFVINGEYVSMKEYLIEYDAVLNYFNQSETERPPIEELQNNIIETLISKKALAQLAAFYNLTTEEDKVNELLENVASGSEEFENDLQTNFGWTVDEFKERVLHPIVLANQMSEYISKDPEVQSEAYLLAKSGIERLDSGEEFEVVAGDISSDFTAKTGGDIGYIAESKLVEPWASAVKDLEIGNNSEIIDSNESFLIFKVTDRISKGEDNEVKLSVIVVNKKTLDQIIDQFIEQSEIKRYVGRI